MNHVIDNDEVDDPPTMISMMTLLLTTRVTMPLTLMNDETGDAHVYDADVDDGVDHVTGDAVDDPPTMISMLTMMLMTREGWARGAGTR